MIRYVGRAVGTRLRGGGRRAGRVGQRADGAEHVPEQRVELVRRAGRGAAPRRGDARVHGRAEQGRGPAARAHHCRVDGPVEGTERVRRFSPLPGFAARPGTLATAVVLT